MKVKVTNRSDKGIEDCDGRGAIEIEIQSKNKTMNLSFCDGEPEDNNIRRNFGDVHDIEEALRMAYDSGCNGEIWELESGESDEI